MPRQYRLKRPRVYLYFDEDKIDEGFKQCGPDHPHVVLRGRPSHAVKSILKSIEIEAASLVLEGNEDLMSHITMIGQMEKVNKESRDAAIQTMQDAGFTLADIRKFNADQARQVQRSQLYKLALLIRDIGGNWDYYPEDTSSHDWPKMKYPINFDSEDKVKVDVEKRVDFLSLLAEDDLERIRDALDGKLELTEKERKNSSAPPS